MISFFLSSAPPRLRVRPLLLAAGAFCIMGALSVAQEKPITNRPPWATSRIQGSPEPPAPYRIVPAFPRLRFDKPTCIEEITETNRLLITERDGRIFTFPKTRDIAQPDLVLDLRELLPNNLAGQPVSLLDAEMHPKFSDNRYLFLCYVHPAEGGHTRLSRFTLTRDNAPKSVPASELVILTWPSGGHNAGCLEFGTDGFLYIATGDGSGPNPPDGRTTGQDVSDLLGAILRIDVDRPTVGQASSLPYSIPADNPFVNQSGARPEIWAYGLRNPWKFGVDFQTGNIFAADNGWESWEMVHRIVRGGNCGWPVMEGRVALRSEVQPGPTPIIPPVKDHPHTEANSVIGGPVYRGNKLADLAGAFVYGDYITGTIWAIRPDKDGAYSHTTLVDTDQRIVAFTQGSQGELFVLDYDFTGQIYELLPSGLRDTSASFPRRLSETGLFTSLRIMQPAPGVVPYSVKVNPWMDGVFAERWVAIPGTGRIELSSSNDTPAKYPEGTVLVKHLSLPQSNTHFIRLETQILHFENGIWNPYSYLWDDAGHDATLVEARGADRPLKVEDSLAPSGSIERTWHVNAVNECKLCHNVGPKFVLGFVPNQLDRQIEGRFASIGQLGALAAQGVLASALAISPNDPSRLVEPHDPAQLIDNRPHSELLDDRARSYLHVNCAMCHHPGGNAIVSFFLRRDLPFDKLNTNKGTGIGTFGMQDAKIIVPGDPTRSVLMYRMAKLGYARMPYIGSRVVDSRGVALIDQWIRSLLGDASDDHSIATATQSLTTARSLQGPPQEEAIGTLVKSTSGSLALISMMHGRSLSPQDYQVAVSRGSKSPTSDIRGLFETFIPESQRRATLGSNIDPASILTRQGDRDRGKLIFFSDNARCRTCHEIDDRSKSFGPTLQEINHKYPRAAELLEHVLKPSLKIDDLYVAYAVLTDDGRAINGLLVEQTENEIVIKTPEKKLLRLERKSIVQLQKSQKSLMPDLILSDLTAQEAADLFEYIRSMGSPP